MYDVSVGFVIYYAAKSQKRGANRWDLEEIKEIEGWKELIVADLWNRWI